MSGWRAAAAVVGMAAVWLSGLTLVARGQASATRQTVAPAAGKKAGEALKNVTTRALKELRVDDFIDSMGLIYANLVLDFAYFHPNAVTYISYFVVDTPRKVTARRMVDMVSTLNRANFAGVQRV